MADTLYSVSNEPYTGQHFRLEVDGVVIGRFLEVSGLEMTIGVEEYAEGGQNGSTRKFPSRITWPNIVFKRGLTNDDELFNWVSQSSGEGFARNKNKLTRPTASITLLGNDGSGKPLRTWTLIDPFPVRWVGPRFSARESNVLEEEIEVAHHGFTSKISR